MLLFEQLLNGIVTGSVYSIVAVGMTMIFGVLRAINFAHGEYYMFGTFGGWIVLDWLGLPYPAAIVAGVLATFLVAALVGQVVMRHMVGRSAEAGVLATLGIALVLQNTVIFFLGGSYKFFAGGYIEPVEFWGISLAQQRILILVVVVLIFSTLEFMVTYTRFGKSMRAVAQNIECCEVVGIDVPKVVFRTFVLGAILAGLAGVLTGPINVTIYPGMGEIITYKTLPIIVMGGLGNVRGTLVAAMVLGVAESFVSAYMGLQYRDAVGFATLILILMVRPHGLFGTTTRF
ncbi:MAG: branched-chain amino acid ABC transporter permease [Geminicoccaceae bacterium]